MPDTKEPMLAVGQQVTLPLGGVARVASVMGDFVLVETHDVVKAEKLKPTGKWYCTCGTLLEAKSKRHYHHSVNDLPST